MWSGLLRNALALAVLLIWQRDAMATTPYGQQKTTGQQLKTVNIVPDFLRFWDETRSDDEGELCSAISPNRNCRTPGTVQGQYYTVVQFKQHCRSGPRNRRVPEEGRAVRSGHTGSEPASGTGRDRIRSGVSEGVA